MNTLTSDNFDRIWLEPREGADPYIGRQWCQDNQWGDDGIEYVRADIATPKDHLVGLERDPQALRNYCCQLLDMLQNYDVEIEGEDNDLVAHISRAVDPAHKEAGTPDHG